MSAVEQELHVVDAQRGQRFGRFLHEVVEQRALAFVEREDAFLDGIADDQPDDVHAARLSDTNRNSGGDDSDRRAAMGALLNFCPVIALKGSAMRPFDADALMQELKRANVFLERVTSASKHYSGRIRLVFKAFRKEQVDSIITAIKNINGVKQVVKS